MIDHSKIDCVGCTACAAICPKNVIQMERDSEGFQVPHIAYPELCIDCGLCEKACPVLNLAPETPNSESAYIVQNRDITVRKESASGGMFSAIALSVLENGGIVYGAAYDASFQVKHIAIDRREDLWKLRNSKYVQSNLDTVFRGVKKDLSSGRQVCFSGTPCQIEGLRSYLGRDYENLLLVDLVCHGVSSPLVWEKYLQTIQKYHPRKIYFRWKHYGYKYSTMSIFNENDQEVYFAGVESDKMLRAYFTNNCDRESCYRCVFKKRYRSSDFTMWDCFQPRFFDKAFDDDIGTSCVLLNSPKGHRQFKRILQMGLIDAKQVDADALTFGNNEMVGSVKRGDLRDTFLLDAAKMEPEELFAKYFPDTVKTKIKKWTRLFLVKSGMYNFFKYRLFLYRRNRAKK